MAGGRPTVPKLNRDERRPRRGAPKRSRHQRGLGNLAPLVESPSHTRHPIDAREHQRHLVANLCKLLGTRFDRPRADTSDDHRNGNGASNASGELSTAAEVDPIAATLSPRMLQTLDRMLSGDSEKQIARALGVSPHTVHVYVKGIYRAYDVCSRGELLARFVRRR